MSRFDVKNFVSPPDPELICGICMNVLDDPKETPCRHVFCRVCITTALDTKHKCPMCRSRCKNRDLKPVLPLVQNLLNKLPMRCVNYRKGEPSTSCKQTIKKEFYFDHINKCDFGYVSCHNAGCTAHFFRKDRHAHKKSCDYRTVTCTKGCSTQYRWKDRSSHNCLKALRKVVKELEREKQELLKKVAQLTAACKHKPDAASGEGSANRPQGNTFGTGWSALIDLTATTGNEATQSATSQEEDNALPSRRVAPAAQEWEDRRRQGAWGMFGFGSATGAASSSARHDVDGATGSSIQGQGNVYNSYGPPVVDIYEEDLQVNYAQNGAGSEDNRSAEQQTQNRDERHEQAPPIINVASSAYDDDDQEEPDYDPADDADYPYLDDDHYYEEEYGNYDIDDRWAFPSPSYPSPWSNDEEDHDRDEALRSYSSPNDDDDDDDDESYSTEQGDHNVSSSLNNINSIQPEPSLANDDNLSRGVFSGEAVLEENVTDHGNYFGSNPVLDEEGLEEPESRVAGPSNASFSLHLGQRRTREQEEEDDDRADHRKRRRTSGAQNSSFVGDATVTATSENGFVELEGSERPWSPHIPWTYPLDTASTTTSTSTTTTTSETASDGDRRRSARLQGITPSPSTIPNVAVPLSTAQLLDRYAGSDDEEDDDDSDDPSWESDED
ncbi:E3 ubiquitin-protein ligase NRDP1 [Elysia marginata]|uniref:E3 ubiquitin-protein ligase NRDP1 n=1 Tax=Elysia marginata TaxID=1093978 RepID=A0AAV4I265_9GAST|nr:E3 ubiquitin-protein ligase NRDP1 [Elysia marginata]